MANPTNLTPHKKTASGKLDLKYAKDKDAEKVKGVFTYHEVPGGSFSFVYRQYPGEKPERYDLIDGGVYTVPRGVAKHLNKNCWYPEYAFVKGEQGDQGMKTGFGGGNMMRVQHKVRRTAFSSLEFLDIDDLEQNAKMLSKVEIVNPMV